MIEKSSVKEYTGELQDYKIACSSRTKSESQRSKRLQALKNYCCK